MSKPVQPVTLHILDKEYKIACAKEEQDTLLHTAQALDKQMRRIRDTGKVSGIDRIAVLAALNLVNEPVVTAGGLDEDISVRLVELRRKIENVLENGLENP